MRWIFASLVLLFAGCADSAPSGSDATAGADAAGDSSAAAATTYKPFDPANAEPYQIRVAAQTKIAAIVDGDKFAAGDFGKPCGQYNAKAATPSDPTKIGSLYVESQALQGNVQERQDKHADNAGAEIGKQLDAQICAAIEAGGKTTAGKDAVGGVLWHGQIVAKSLLHYQYVAWYDYLRAGNRTDWDEGMGVYGRSFDGKTAGGLAELAAERDAACGTTLAKEIWTALLTGKALVDGALKKAGKNGPEDELDKLTPELDALSATVDGKMQQVLALAVGHELAELQAGKGGAVELMEARMFWQMLKPRVLAFDKAKGTQHAATFGQLDGDDYAKVKAADILAAVKAIWAVDAVALCK